MNYISFFKSFYLLSKNILLPVIISNFHSIIQNEFFFNTSVQYYIYKTNINIKKWTDLVMLSWLRFSQLSIN